MASYSGSVGKQGSTLSVMSPLSLKITLPAEEYPIDVSLGNMGTSGSNAKWSLTGGNYGQKYYYAMYICDANGANSYSLGTLAIEGQRTNTTWAGGASFTGTNLTGKALYIRASNSSAPTLYLVNKATVTVKTNVRTYTVTVSASSGGSLTSSASSVAAGKAVTLTPTANTGYQLTGYTATPSSLAIVNNAFTMPSSNVSVRAIFEKIDYALSDVCDPAAGGTITFNKASANYGDIVNVKVEAAQGYSVGTITTNPEVVIEGDPTTEDGGNITMPASNVVVTATFIHNLHQITVVRSPAEGGTATADRVTAYYGDVVTLSATANVGYRFLNWSASPVVSIDSNTFTMPDEDIVITANFEHVLYTVVPSINPSPGGSVQVSKYGAYYGDIVEIHATPNEGYEFVRWENNRSVTIQNSADSQFTMPASHITVTAIFKKTDYAITCVTDPSGAGAIVAPQTARMGDSVTISQTPELGWLFDHWSSSQGSSSSDEQFSFIMPASNVTITAHYGPAASVPELSTNDLAGGSNVLLTLTTYSDTFSHKYKINFGDGIDTGWVSIAAGIDSVSIYVPVSWGARSASLTGGTLILETYRGTQKVGESSITGLTYTALGDVAIALNVWRTDGYGNAYRQGRFARYSIVKPSGITSYSLEYGSKKLTNPALEGFVLPGDKKTIAVESSEVVTLRLVYGSETITLVRSVPGYNIVRKGITITT